VCITEETHLQERGKESVALQVLAAWLRGHARERGNGIGD